MAKPHKHNTTAKELNTPRRRPYARMVWAVCLFSGLLPGRSGSDGRECRSEGRLRRPGSAKRSNAQRTFPHDDSDVAWLRSGWLSSRSTDDSVGTIPLPADGPGSRPRLGEPVVRHLSCCLRRRPCVLGATANWNRSSQLTVAAALTMRSSTSPNKSLRLSALTLSAHYLNTPNTCGGYTHGS